MQDDYAESYAMAKNEDAITNIINKFCIPAELSWHMIDEVTAVGHAAILAAIQRYMPSLIPSTYGPDRLDLLRQLEKVKEMETEVNPTEKADE
ncbi:hypothetical protein T459_29714 [Capsicum annuum]|uniref:Uncharacterized protein n=1 Tax=Capsicum annuum TaxID=4072 RepID=A0A2G2Y6H2_CAPAN|nr:hypothetical protein T459_29714 [Capsicum annuum]